MAETRYQVQIPCCNTDGTFANVVLQDFYSTAYNPFTVGDDINLPQACGTEAQWMFAMLSYLHGAWSVKGIGLLAPTVGLEIGTGNSGEIDLGTPV